MINSISVAGANLLTGATIAVGIAVGDASPEIAEIARNAPLDPNVMDYIEYYSDAFGVIIAGISAIGLVSFYIVQIVKMLKDDKK